MTSTDPAAERPAHAERDHKDRDTVTVELNGAPRHIRPGEYTGRTLRLALGVPAEYELDEVVHGEFKPIANDSKICVKGGEKFVSHVGQGQAS